MNTVASPTWISLTILIEVVQNICKIFQICKTDLLYLFNYLQWHESLYEYVLLKEVEKYLIKKISICILQWTIPIIFI